MPWGVYADNLDLNNLIRDKYIYRVYQLGKMQKHKG